jgi:DNA repair exonuclease SbcCD ATPase subunit
MTSQPAHLEKLTLKGFQGHKDSTLEFHPNVNAIVGTSGNGKSTILKSIRWVAANRPMGASIINRDSDEASVAMSFADQVKVARFRNRSGSENGYEIRIGKGDPATLVAVGHDVPPMVSDALNLVDINFQRQFEPYFLVFESPGKVAAHFRSMAGADVVDAVATKLSAKSRSTATAIQETRDRLADIDKKLEVIATISVVEIQRWLKLTQAAEQKAESLTTSAEDLQRLIDAYDDTEAQLAAIASADLSTVTENLQEMESMLTGLGQQSQRMNSLGGLIEEYESNSRDLHNTTVALSAAESALATLKNTTSVCPVCDRPFKENKR